MNDRDQQFRRLFGELRIGAQQRYYTARRTEYGRAHRQAVVVRNALLFAAAAAAAVGQAVSPTARAAWSIASAVLAALAAAVTAFETLIGFPQLEKLYADAARNLEEAEIDWRVAAPEDLPAEVERVEIVCRSERGQWGQLIVTSAPPPAPEPAEPKAE